MDLEVLQRILDGREKPTNLSFTLLKSITENISDDREIGHGGFATVYKVNYFNTPSVPKYKSL